MNTIVQVIILQCTIPNKTEIFLLKRKTCVDHLFEGSTTQIETGKEPLIGGCEQLKPGRGHSKIVTWQHMTLSPNPQSFLPIRPLGMKYTHSSEATICRWCQVQQERKPQSVSVADTRKGHTGKGTDMCICMHLCSTVG